MVGRTLFYFVVPDDENWTIIVGDRRYSFPDKQSALRAAVEGAGLDRVSGATVEIRVRGSDGTWHVEPM